ncbi:tetraspanin-13a isoform X2 [Electrophorus electricus]|uniref:Tetraspanin 13a n=1 Tax=Electrophorus electricus TaxID=8005 RepID=A0A4W4E900_ELEEL|nr:tetraspanin-13a isoform X2 [Electrophorus electricus]
MACGGFICSKNSLCALNLLYMLVSLLTIALAAWGKWFGLVSSFPVVAAIIGVGVFLFIVATVGLCGALKHHQVLLFFYMLILFMVFIVQFSVSCACLAVKKEQQMKILEIGWNKSKAMQTGLEETLNCCDFAQVNYNRTCEAVCFRSQQCEPCSVKLQAHVEDALNVVGGVSLFFSFTEILGVWLSYRYRNQKDPRSNPGAFI